VATAAMWEITISVGTEIGSESNYMQPSHLIPPQAQLMPLALRHDLRYDISVHGLSSTGSLSIRTRDGTLHYLVGFTSFKGLHL
jgi:hypothetical protein